MLPPVPSLIESSGEEDNLFSDDEKYPDKVFGEFPWGTNRSTNAGTQVEMWGKLSRTYQHEVLDCCHVLLVAPILFTRQTMPLKYMNWASECGLSSLERLMADVSEEGNVLDSHELVGLDLLREAHHALRSVVTSRVDNVAVVKFAKEIDQLKINDIKRAIALGSTQPQIKRLIDAMSCVADEHPPSADPPPKLKMNLYDFASSDDRKVVAALMTARQYAEVLHMMGQEGRDVVKELLAQQTEKDEMIGYKESGNKYFKESKFSEAVKQYSIAIKSYPYIAVLYSNRCKAAINLHNYKLAISDAYRAVTLKPEWGKAYYRLADALNHDGQYAAAIRKIDMGLTKCFNITERQELSKIRLALEEKLVKAGISHLALNGINNNLPEKPKKTKKKKKKSKAQAPEETESKAGQNKDLETKSETKENKNPNSDVISGNNDVIKKHEVNQSKKKNNEKILEKKAREPSPTTPPSVEYLELVRSASKAICNNRYHDAAKDYNLAIQLMLSVGSQISMTAPEKFVLYYVRGSASLETRLPGEIRSSINYFNFICGNERPVATFNHPMALYAKAHALYLLNNFTVSGEALQQANHVIKRSQFRGFLTYPGTDQVIPESSLSKLSQLMKQLTSLLRHPPSPVAVCRYDDCYKENKRKEIYSTDFNFEGFVQVSCHWKCVICFHIKCWTKLRNETYEKKRDKDVFTQPCVTDGCRGQIYKISIIDEFEQIKKHKWEGNLIDERVAKQHVKQSKNDRNFIKRRKSMKEAKERKLKWRESNRVEELPEENKEPEVLKEIPENKPLKVITEQDLLNAQVLRKDEKEIETTTKTVKNKKNKQKKKGAVSLRDFLGRGNITSEQAFEISENEKLLMDIYSYFEDFFSHNGPMHVTNALLIQQIFHLPNNMRSCVYQHNGIISFLKMNPRKFCLVRSYIGLLRHEEQLFKLADIDDELLAAQESKQLAENMMLDSLDTFGGNSDFARDLYQVGDIPLDKIVDITWIPPSENPPQSNKTGVSPPDYSDTESQPVLNEAGPPPNRLLSWTKLSDDQFMAKQKAVDESSPYVSNPTGNLPVTDANVEKVPNRNPPGLTLPARIPPAGNPPVVKSPAGIPSVVKSPAGNPPVVKSPGGNPPVVKSPAGNPPVVKSSAGNPPVVKSPAGNPPVVKSPAGNPPVVKSPAGNPPVVKSPAGNPPVVKSPAGNPPVVKSPAGNSPVGKSPAGNPPVVKLPAENFPVVKSPAGNPPVVSDNSLSNKIDEYLGSSIPQTSGALSIDGVTISPPPNLPTSGGINATKLLDPSSGMQPPQDDPNIIKAFNLSGGRGLFQDTININTSDVAPVPDDANLPFKRDGNTKFFYVKKKKTSKYVQATMTSSTRGVQTKIIPSYEAAIRKLDDEKFMLQNRLEEVNDKFTRLTMTSRTETTTANKKIAELEGDLKSANERAASATQQLEAENRKITKDRQTWMDSIKIMKKQVKDAQDEALQLHRVVEEKEKEILNSRRKLSSLTSESTKLTGDREKLTRLLDDEKKRTMEAELQTLETKENLGLRVLVKARSDCHKISMDMERLARQCVENATIYRELGAGYNIWRSNMEACSSLIKQINKQFAAQSEQIRSGVPLKDLPEIQIPNPPPPGPMPQQIMMRLRITGQPLNLQALSPKETGEPPAPSMPTPRVESPRSSGSPRPAQRPIGTGKPQPRNPQPNNNQQNNEATAAPPKGSFERIMIQLSTLFPNTARQDLALCIKEVRQNNNNSLTGLSLDDIIKQASIVLHKKGIVRSQSGASAPHNGGASAHTWKPQLQTTYRGNDDDEPCVICHEALHALTVHKLKCGHVFHNDCLRQWLSRNRTCPTCRGHAIDTSEYPALS